MQVFIKLPGTVSRKISGFPVANSHPYIREHLHNYPNCNLRSIGLTKNNKSILKKFFIILRGRYLLILKTKITRLYESIFVYIANI